MTTLTDAALTVPHIVGGRLVEGSELEYKDRIGGVFRTPALDLDAVVVPRSEDPPCADVPINEIIAFIGETGRRLADASNPYLAEALEMTAAISIHSRRVIENSYAGLPRMFEPEVLAFQVDREVGRAPLDGWDLVERPGGRRPGLVRAFPPRLVHVSAGNGPGGAAFSIVRGALTKGINLLKLPSNDLFTGTAVLRTMADIDPDHPVVRSFSAIYWRGGDDAVESRLFHPQFFDKIVAWGGESTVRHIVKHLGPGLELVAFDPKISISLIGREAFADEATTADVARRAALDVGLSNQEGCSASRVQFIEGDLEQIDRYCELLAAELAVDRDRSDGTFIRTPADIRETVDVLRYLDNTAVFGDYEGHGLVVRTSDMPDFHPIAKTVVVMPVDDLRSALSNANVATQTVGVFPFSRKAEVRDRLAAAGVQRVVSLGAATGLTTGEGLPHDGFYPLQRLMRWVTDEPDDEGN